MVKTLLTGAILIAVCFSTDPLYAAHPLTTDDAGTQGSGNAQLEFIGEYGYDREEGVTTTRSLLPTVPVLSYGVGDALDLVIGAAYQRFEIKQEGTRTSERGLTDAVLQLKWRFYEKDGLGFAVKPGISIPTGNEQRGLGRGALSYGTLFIATKEIKPWAFHGNAGYMRNQYKLQADQDANRKNIWHISAACQVDMAGGLKAVSNIGAERNPGKTSNMNPAFLVVGFIYSVTGKIDLDFGIKRGLNRAETDIAYLAGFTWRL